MLSVGQVQAILDGCVHLRLDIPLERSGNPLRAFMTDAATLVGRPRSWWAWWRSGVGPLTSRRRFMRSPAVSESPITTTTGGT